MGALLELLDHPEHSFRSAHVVGTNGKSSVTLLCSALLEACGLETGACVSPHVFRWSERVRIGGAEVEPEAFAAAVAEVAAAAAAVEVGFAEGERITQFEAQVAAAFVAFREAGVEFAVIEAGLGGRLDATNVIPSEATALTSVGLDHTEWLGETVEEIAAEKLAVLRAGTALVCGPLPAGVRGLARATAADRGARLVEVAEPESTGADASLPGYLRTDAAIARALAGALLGPGSEVDIEAAALETVRLPGRLEMLAGEPTVVLDAAHNPQGAEALARSLPELVGDRPLVACLAILSDKDAEGFVAALAPSLELAVATAAEPGPAMGRPGAEPVPAGDLAALLEAAGVSAEAIADQAVAIARALELAGERDGVALFAGSHYLLRQVWTARHDQSCSR